MVERDADAWDLGARVQRVLCILAKHERGSCSACKSSICGHDVVFSIVTGHEDKPLCAPCTATELRRPLSTILAELGAYVASKECLTIGWRRASLRESAPTCAARGAAAAEPPAPANLDAGAPPVGSDAEWDAGALGCGELVLELRRRMEALEPDAVLLLRATDLGAPEDLPAWCGLTGHRLLAANHPCYWIRRRS